MSSSSAVLVKMRECNCNKNLSSLNEANRRKHLQRCGVKRHSSAITSFFTKKSKLSDNVPDVGAGDNAADVVGAGDNVPDVVGAGDNAPDVLSIAEGIRSGKCAGYVVSLVNRDDIYSKFPFTLLPRLSIVFENGRFHVSQCAIKDYELYEATAETVDVNKKCFMLKFSPPFIKVLGNMANDSYHKSATHHVNLSHQQMVQRAISYKTLYEEQRMSTFNFAKKYNRVNKSLELHQRFLLLIKENNIRRLHVVKVALNAKRSISYIINKVVDAIDGIYTPQYSQDDKDIAFLILQFGGPGLLDMCHRAIKVPSVSTAYNMIKGSACVKSSVTETLEGLTSNIKIEEPIILKHGYMLKMDETFIDQRVRWCPNDNLLYGFCYEHGRDLDLAFDDYKKIQHLSGLAETNQLHIPKDCMVIVQSINGMEGKLKPLVE